MLSEEQLVGVDRNHMGEIISFLTSEGRIISYRKAVQDAECGMINGVNIVEGQDGISALHPNTTPSFDNFPMIY